jgi:hypothetical protein
MADAPQHADSAGHDPAEPADERPAAGSPAELADHSAVPSATRDPADPAAGDEEPPASSLKRALAGWRAWRRSRPFWGGLFLIASGAEMLLIPLPMQSMGLFLHIGTGGVLGILIGALLIASALLIWFNPGQRTFYSIAAVLLAIVALSATNLGGFIIGTLLGVTGGSLAFAWTPIAPDAEPAAPRRRPWGRSPGRHDGSAGLSLVFGDSDAAKRADRAADDSADGAAEGEAEGDEPRGAGRTGYRSADRAAADDLTLPALPAQPAADGEAGRGGTIYRGLPVLPLVLGLVVGILHPGATHAPEACSAPVAAASAQPHPSTAPTPTPSPVSSCPAPSPSPTGSGPVGPDPTASPSPDPTVSGRPIPGPTPKPKKIRKRVAAPAGLVVAAVPSDITANTATLTGLSFDGVADVPTASGTQQMLKFSMSGLNLSGDDNLTVTEGGHTLSIRASSLNFTGNVTLLCTKIHGDLLGVPLTFTPQSPPPLVLPEMVFTNVTTYQPFTSADSLRIGGLLITTR